MNIKYNIGDNIVFIDNGRNKIRTGKILRINIDSSGITYDIEHLVVDDYEVKRGVVEDFIKVSPEECWEYLKENIKEIFPYR